MSPFEPAIEIDADSGAEVYRLTSAPAGCDNIYGEQPYNSPDGRIVAFRTYARGGDAGNLSLLNLDDGSVRQVAATSRFPDFHGWGERMYFQEPRGDERIVRRCRYDAGQPEDVTALPRNIGRIGYGAVSPDERWYVFTTRPPEGEPWPVMAIDLVSGELRTLVTSDKWRFGHQQFSRDGHNRLLVQGDWLADKRHIDLGEIDVETGAMRLLPADEPHTTKPTGHETWVAATARAFFSTHPDPARAGNLYTASLGDDEPTLVTETPIWFVHVSVSRCGRYWLADAIHEPGVPVFVGSIATGRFRRLALSRTEMTDQTSHTHPYMTADNRWVIFSSNRSGAPQVYGARLPDGWLGELDT